VIDRQRKEIRKAMLSHPRYSWRRLSTLSAVIGCKKEQTKKPLLAIGARASENNDGLWGRIKNHPLNTMK
jgi:hypothetical protein